MWRDVISRESFGIGISRITSLAGRPARTKPSFIEEGPPGLKNRPRSPRSAPHRTEQKVIDALLELRHKHPSWANTILLPMFPIVHTMLLRNT
jgi:hypothetical protein